MGINVSSLAVKEDFNYGGKNYGTIRAIVPQDLAVVLATFKGSISELFGAADSLDFKTLDVKDVDKLADQLTERGPQFLLSLARNVPGLLANIIAVCADDPDMAVEVEAGMPLPAQMAYLSKLAVISFGDVQGFKEFVGNVYALISAVEALTSAPTLKSAIEAAKSDSTAG